MPVYATITMIMFLSSMGLPLLNGFVGEFTILQGTFLENKYWAAWAVPGVVLAAAYLLWLYQRVFFGKVTNPKNEKLADLTPREVACFVPLLILAFCDRIVSEAAVPDPRETDELIWCELHPQQRILQRATPALTLRLLEGGTRLIRAEERPRTARLGHGIIGQPAKK